MIKKIWENFINKISWFYLFYTSILITCILIIDKKDKWEVFPTFCIASVALVFSYYTYKSSKEKFRLDLMERRLIIYDNIVKFCGCVVETGTFQVNEKNKETVQSAHDAAYQSFRGMGWHKTKLLFDKDIEDLVLKLNRSYAYLVSYSDYPIGKSDYQTVVKTRMEHLQFIVETNEKLPELFKAYIYFGEYKADTNIK